MYSHIFWNCILRYYVEVVVVPMHKFLWLDYVMDSLLYHQMFKVWDVIIDSICEYEILRCEMHSFVLKHEIQICVMIMTRCMLYFVLYGFPMCGK